MTFNPYDFTDPSQSGQSPFSGPQIPGPMGPGMVQQPQSGPWRFPQPPFQAGPLGGMQSEVSSVLNGNGTGNRIYFPVGQDGPIVSMPRYRQYGMLGAWAKGALLGFGSWYVWNRMRKRRQVKREWTSPGFRALALLLFPLLAGFVLSMLNPVQSTLFLGWGAVIGLVLAVVYTIYRAAGGGRYNSRRRGSPWRADRKGH